MALKIVNPDSLLTKTQKKDRRVEFLNNTASCNFVQKQPIRTKTGVIVYPTYYVLNGLFKVFLGNTYCPDGRNWKFYNYQRLVK